MVGNFVFKLLLNITGILVYREAENSTGRKKNQKNRRPTAGNTTGEPMAHGPWPMAQGPWPKAHGPWPMAQGPRPKAHGPWPMAHGPWPTAQGPWPMAHGPRPMAHGPKIYNIFNILHELALERCYELLDRSERPALNLFLSGCDQSLPRPRSQLNK